MITATRPSKTFLYRLLSENLSAIKGKIGIDAASANFKNMRMFSTETYLGLDNDIASLRSGVSRLEGSRTAYGILCDLSRLDALEDNIADVVVSTNTLYWLPPGPRVQAILHLSRLTKSEGLLLVEMILDEHFDRQLGVISATFTDVKVVYYRNWLSRLYERLFERDGYLGYHPIASSRPFLRLSSALSRLEYLTWRNRSANRHAFVIASGKPPTAEGNLDIRRLCTIESGIYSLPDSIS